MFPHLDIFPRFEYSGPAQPGTARHSPAQQADDPRPQDRLDVAWLARKKGVLVQLFRFSPSEVKCEPLPPGHLPVAKSVAPTSTALIGVFSGEEVDCSTTEYSHIVRTLRIDQLD